MYLGCRSFRFCFWVSWREKIFSLLDFEILSSISFRFSVVKYHFFMNLCQKIFIICCLKINCIYIHIFLPYFYSFRIEQVLFFPYEGIHTYFVWFRAFKGQLQFQSTYWAASKCRWWFLPNLNFFIWIKEFGLPCQSEAKFRDFQFGFICCKCWIFCLISARALDWWTPKSKSRIQISRAWPIKNLLICCRQLFYLRSL